LVRRESGFSTEVKLLLRRHRKVGSAEYAIRDGKNQRNKEDRLREDIQSCPGLLPDTSRKMFGEVDARGEDVDGKVETALQLLDQTLTVTDSDEGEVDTAREKRDQRGEWGD
jgi:hypothetical protein